MGNYLRTIVVGAVILCPYIVDAGSKPKVSIVLNGTKSGVSLQPEVASDNLKMLRPKWFKNKTKKALVVSGKKKLKNAWEKFSFSFTPSEDGKVLISFKGTYCMPDDEILPKDIWVDYDTISVKGGKLKNSSFDTVDSKQKLKWWWRLGKHRPEKKEAKLLIENSTEAHSGDRFIRVSNNEGVAQNIKVKAGQIVTVTFFAKAQ